MNQTIETLIPETEQEWLELRAKDITSTDVSALFGISPWCTPFELWHRKNDSLVVLLEENEFMKWGTRLQDSIAAGVAEDNEWDIRRMNEYIRLPELRMGASFDFSIESMKVMTASEVLHRQAEIGKENPTPYRGLLEVKNVFGLKFQQEWLTDEEGNIEAPPHIEIQVQHQLAVSGRAFAYIAALVGGNKIVLLKRTPDPKIIEAIKAKVAVFWKSVEAGTPPSPNFTKDAEFIKSLYQYAEPNKIFYAQSGDRISQLMELYKAASEDEKAAAAQKEAFKTEILTLVGDAEKCVGESFSLSLGMIAEAPISYVRKAYRMFKPSYKGAKK